MKPLLLPTIKDWIPNYLRTRRRLACLILLGIVSWIHPQPGFVSQTQRTCH